MDDVRSLRKRGIKSTRDVLQKWNEYYINTNFGIGIQCDSCKKWRKVSQYQDKSEVPDIWTCSMWEIDEMQKGDCSIPSDLTEDDFTDAQFVPGSLVWAKMPGEEWWPGMVEDCPDSQEYFLKYEDAEDEYHVTFFGDTPSRNWIDASKVMDFNDHPPPSPKRKKRGHETKLQRAIAQANEASQMIIKERLKKYSFLVRYKGSWLKIKKLGVVNLPPNCLKGSKPKQSSESRSQVTDQNSCASRDSNETPVVSKMKKRKLKFGTKRKFMEDDEEFQATGNQSEDAKKDNDSGNHMAILEMPCGEEKQQSLKTLDKHFCRLFDFYLSPEKSNKNSINECQKPFLTEGNDEPQTKETGNFDELSDTILVSENGEDNQDEDNKNSIINECQKPFLTEGNDEPQTKETGNFDELSDTILVSENGEDNQDEEDRLCKENSENEENMEKIDSDADKFSFSRMYEASLEKKRLSLGNTVEGIDPESLSDTDINNNTVYSPISENGQVTEIENAATFSRTDSDSNALLPPLYASCSDHRNEQYSNQPESFKKNLELADEIINSNSENAATSSENGSVINHENSTASPETDSDASLQKYASSSVHRNEQYFNEFERLKENWKPAEEFVNSKYRNCIPFLFDRRRI